MRAALAPEARLARFAHWGRAVRKGAQMKWVVMVLVISMPGAALASGRGSYGPHSRYDASLDFSKAFDEEVKWQREHPRDDQADDFVPAPRDDDEPRVKHRRRRSHRAR